MREKIKILSCYSSLIHLTYSNQRPQNNPNVDQHENKLTDCIIHTQWNITQS